VFEEEPVSLRWVAGAEASHSVPIAMAAERAKTLRTAGRIADRVLVGLGNLPEVIETAVELVNEDARAAGRTPADVETWVLAKVNVAEGYEEAVDGIKMALAASAHHSLQFTMANKGVPDEHRAALEELVRR
jgi:5,10-methylenetetrahydromethanopterin reductase